MSNISPTEWVKMGIDAGFLPASYTVPVPAGIMGKPFTYATIDLAKVIGDLVGTGVNRKHSTKVADAKQKAILDTNEKLGTMFVERFKAGIWNERAGGGPRLDGLEKFLRMRAIDKAKEKLREAKKPLDDADEVARIRDLILANEKWRTATEAEYKPATADIDLSELGL